MFEFRRKIIDFGVLFPAITFRISKFRRRVLDGEGAARRGGPLRRERGKRSASRCRNLLSKTQAFLR